MLYLFDTFNAKMLCASYKLELAYDTSHELTSYFYVGDTILLTLTLKSSSSLSKCSEQKSIKNTFYEVNYQLNKTMNEMCLYFSRSTQEILQNFVSVNNGNEPIG